MASTLSSEVKAFGIEANTADTQTACAATGGGFRVVSAFDAADSFESAQWTIAFSHPVRVENAVVTWETGNTTTTSGSATTEEGGSDLVVTYSVPGGSAAQTEAPVLTVLFSPVALPIEEIQTRTSMSVVGGDSFGAMRVDTPFAPDQCEASDTTPPSAVALAKGQATSSASSTTPSKTCGCK